MSEPQARVDPSIFKSTFLIILLAISGCTNSIPTIPIDEAPVREGRDLRDLASGLEMNRSRILEGFACRKKFYEDNNRPDDVKQLAASEAAYRAVVAAFDGDRVAVDIEQRLIDWHDAQFSRSPARFDDMFGSVTNVIACKDAHASIAALAFSYTQESGRRDAERDAQREKRQQAQEEADEADGKQERRPRSYMERVDADRWFLWRYRDEMNTREGLVEGLRVAARQGDGMALEVLGSWHEAGFIVTRDLAKAAEYYEAAIRDEEYEAAARLGLMHVADSSDFSAARRAIERIDNAVEFDYAPWAQLPYSQILPRDHSATIDQI